MDIYLCSNCKEVFKKTWSDEECKADAEKIFGGPMPPGEGELVCDNCYNEIMKFAKAKNLPLKWKY